MTTDILAHLAQGIAVVAIVAGAFVLIIWAFGDKPPKDRGR